MKRHLSTVSFFLPAVFLLLLVSVTAKAPATSSREAAPLRHENKRTITLSTTTSTLDSGLLGVLLPHFTRETGWHVDVIAVGTGAALRMGRDGDADVLLVHARAEEEQFVAQGWGIRRYDVMYNDFLVVGPLGAEAIPGNSDVLYTFREIASRGLPFVSRGDNSGTHTMEMSLWRAAGIDTAGLARYVSVGQGMGATLQMANELQAYTLTDRATWLTQTRSARINLPAVCEKHESLLNYYGVIAVNPARQPHVNARGAEAFVEWILSPGTQALIGTYGVAEYGSPLFTPNAGTFTPPAAPARGN